MKKILKTATDELLQANLGMFGADQAKDAKPARLERIAKNLKKPKTSPT